MEVEWEARPVPIIHWTETPQPAAGPSTTSTATTSSFVAFAQRRRSSVLHGPPAAPPPSQPIPSIPVLPFEEGRRTTGGGGATSSSPPPLPPAPDGDSHPPFARPSASAGLAAVAAFSQARLASSSPPYAMYTGSSSSPPPMDYLPPSFQNLSDSPPRSILRSATSLSARGGIAPAPGPALPPPTTALPPPPQHQEIGPDRMLHPPLDPRAPSSTANDPGAPAQTRPSSRRALTRALELAREAVKLDSTNDDPHAAIVAYGRSVALLSEVMERVMRGEDTTENRRRNGRRRSVVAQEEEVRRLKSIHDTYADRMNILSLIYSIPAPAPDPTTSYAAASRSTTRAPTPSGHTPGSEFSDPLSLSKTPSLISDHTHGSDSEGGYSDSADEGDGVEAIGSAMFSLQASPGVANSPATPMAGNISHPYASPPRMSSERMSSDSRRATSPSPSPPIGFPSNRASNVPPARPAPSGPLPLRPRTTIGLPPPPPPPQDALPPAPTPGSSRVSPPPDTTNKVGLGLPQRMLEHGRQRTISMSHKRTPSATRLAALQEEAERPLPPQPSAMSQQPYSEQDQPVRRARARSVVQPLQIGSTESPPLPPVPSSASPLSPLTPRYPTSDYEPRSPSPSASITPRPMARGGSSASIKSTTAATNGSGQPLMLASTNMGTISQRRNKPSDPGASAVSPTDSTGSSISSSSGPPPSRLTASTLPASTATSLGMAARLRSTSQSATGNRRPSVSASVANGQMGVNGVRKISGTSKLNPGAQQLLQQPPQLTIMTGQLSPIVTTSTFSLVPPPPLLPNSLPTTPTSPLPAAAPAEPMRKPYHLMNLLRATMTSKSGGYVTRRLHVPQEVWSQGGAKLLNLPEKVRVVEVLCSALEDIQNSSVEYFGVGSLTGQGIGNVMKREGEAWAAKLEDFTAVCDGIVANFGKKLGVGEGLTSKKTSGMGSWGGKLTRQLDKFTNNTKNLDSPATYVQGLARLFVHAQVLDEHTKALLSSPVAPVYSALSPELRASLEIKLKHTSEFFASVVLTFVIRDLSLLLDKYAKKCEKWLEE